LLYLRRLIRYKIKESNVVATSHILDFLPDTNDKKCRNLVECKSKIMNMRKILARLLIILILFVGSVIYWKYFFTYSEGYRAGLLQKFSSKGSIFKTYEGEIILSSVQTTTNMAIASEKFYFSVTNEDIARKIEKLQGESVVVHYTEKNGTLPWNGESPYIVDSVTIRR